MQALQQMKSSNCTVADTLGSVASDLEARIKQLVEMEDTHSVHCEDIEYQSSEEERLIELNRDVDNTMEEVFGVVSDSPDSPHWRYYPCNWHTSL